MKLDMRVNGVLHKDGGIIERIDRIQHDCDTPKDGRSRDFWYFVGTVQWDDGGRGENVPIPPYALCARGHDGKQAIDDLCAFMNDYLMINGEWFRDGKTKHEGWYANERPKVRRRA